MNPLPEGAYLLLKKILTETFSKKANILFLLSTSQYQNGTSKIFLNFSPSGKKDHRNLGTSYDAPKKFRETPPHGNKL